MANWSFYAGASPSLDAAMRNILSGESVRADANTRELGGLSSAALAAEQTKKLMAEREAESRRMAELPGYAAEHSAALAGSTVPRFQQYRRYVQTGDTGIPDEAGNINPWLGEGGAGPTPESTSLSQALANYAGLMMGKQGGVGDIAGAAKTYAADIPTSRAELPGKIAKGRQEETLADAMRNQYNNLVAGNREGARDWAAVGHPALLNEDGAAGMTNQARSLTELSKILGMDPNEVFKMLHPGPQQFNMFGAPMSVERKDTGEEVIIVPSKVNPGAYEVMEGVKPKTNPPNRDEVVGGIISKAMEARKQADAQLAADPNPNVKGMIILGPAKNNPGKWLIGPPGTPPDKATYTWP